MRTQERRLPRADRERERGPPDFLDERRGSVLRIVWFSVGMGVVGHAESRRPRRPSPRRERNRSGENRETKERAIERAKAHRTAAE